MTVAPAPRARGNPARAAVVAGGVAVFLTLDLFLGPWSTADFYIGFADGAVLLSMLPWFVLSSPVAQAIAVFLALFLSLWLVLPVTASLRIGAVLLRSLVAAAIGLAGVLLVGVLAWGFGPFGWSADVPLEIVATKEQFEGSLLNPWNALREVVARLLDLLPTTLLGGVLLWVSERHGARAAVV